jgi:hypothetical protein
MTVYNDLMDQNYDPDYDVVLKRGDYGAEVKALQVQLNAQGFTLTPDGIFGTATRNAVIAFQRKVGLVADGIVGPKTYAALEAPTESHSRLLTQADIVSASVELEVPVAAVMAVNTVESRGSGFFKDGRPAILFERHIMYRRLLEHGLNGRRYRQEYPNLVNTMPGGYIGGPSEHARLDRAKEIHDVSALESASWGAFQIMGYHWKRLGYPSVHAFVEGMYRSEAHHLKAFVEFIKADQGLWDALRARDWARFARGYNGPAYAKNQYDVKMANAYQQYIVDQEIA